MDNFIIKLWDGTLVLTAFLSWFSTIIVFVYALCKLTMSKSAKWILSMGVILFGIVFGTGFISLRNIFIPAVLGNDFILTLFFNVNLIFPDLSYYLMFITATLCSLPCLYRIHKTSIIRIGIGAILFLGIAVYQYHYGGMYSYVQFTGGEFNRGTYDLYRKSTYFGQVMLPFSFLYNIIVAPFWCRNGMFKKTTRDGVATQMDNCNDSLNNESK